jgi:hypothetical protein
MRRRSRLSEVIDFTINDLLTTAGVAKPSSIYNAICYDHPDLILAEKERHAKNGLMRDIESRLKRYLDAADEDTNEQPLLPGIPQDLQRRMGQVITVEMDDGVSYFNLYHPKTTIGHVRRHVALLRKQFGALEKKIEAFVEALTRCGPVTDDVPFTDALKAEVLA